MHGVTLSRDGHWLAAGSGDLDRAGPSSVRVWDLTAGKELFTLAGIKGGVRSLHYDRTDAPLSIYRPATGVRLCRSKKANTSGMFFQATDPWSPPAISTYR